MKKFRNVRIQKCIIIVVVWLAASA